MRSLDKRNGMRNLKGSYFHFSQNDMKKFIECNLLDKNLIYNLIKKIKFLQLDYENMFSIFSIFIKYTKSAFP